MLNRFVVRLLKTQTMGDAEGLEVVLESCEHVLFGHTESTHSLVDQTLPLMGIRIRTNCYRGNLEDCITVESR